MKIIKYLLEKIVLLLGVIFVIIPQIIVCCILEFRDWLVSNIRMGKNEVYARIKKVLIVILILAVIFSFVAVINLNGKIEDLIEAQDILIEHIERNDF